MLVSFIQQMYFLNKGRALIFINVLCDNYHLWYFGADFSRQEALSDIHHQLC